MSDELLFQRTVTGLTLEISTESGDPRATVTFPYPDPRFERGGFPIAVSVVVELGRQLAKRDHLRSLFLTELGPTLAEDDALAASPLPLDDIAAWVSAQRVGQVGALDPARGFWLEASDGLATLARLTSPLREASAETSRLRLLLLESEAATARGWDLLLSDGILSFGRWRGSFEAEPDPLDPEDITPTIALLESLATTLAPKLGN